MTDHHDLAQELVSIPLHALNALHADALRYRYLRLHAQALSCHMDGTAWWRIDTEHLPRGRSLDEAIDQACKEEEW